MNHALHKGIGTYFSSGVYSMHLRFTGGSFGSLTSNRAKRSVSLGQFQDDGIEISVDHVLADESADDFLADFFGGFVTQLSPHNFPYIRII